MDPKNDFEEIRRKEKEWQETTLKKQLNSVGERKERFETDSGIPIKPLYTPSDLEENGFDYPSVFRGTFLLPGELTPTCIGASFTESPSLQALLHPRRQTNYINAC